MLKCKAGTWQQLRLVESSMTPRFAWLTGIVDSFRKGDCNQARFCLITAAHYQLIRSAHGLRVLLCIARDEDLGATKGAAD